MAWFDFFWYERNLEHLAEHGVTAEEFQHVVCHTRQRGFGHRGSNMVQGYTAEGRFLCCHFRMIDQITVLPITAYEPTKGNE
jgi:hypothetical protein